MQHFSESGMSSNGHGYPPVEVLDPQYPPLREIPRLPRRRRAPSIWPALVLFLLTVLSTLSVGTEFALSYSQNREPFSGDQNPFAMMLTPFEHPHLLAMGVPFSFTLLVILMVHEMGHFLACRIYGIDASYPYFIPAPTLFGTFGAFIRIRSPITTRRALFDVGIAGPIAGFVIAAPAMVYAIATAKIVPGIASHADLLFGDPPFARMLIGALYPGVDPHSVLLPPIGRAAWMGFFATGLNLLPAWQLDGGHILFSLAPDKHHQASLAVGLALLGLGIYTWHVWVAWGLLLTILSLRYKHPPLYDPWERLDFTRYALAALAIGIFLLSFMIWPTTNP
jgi:membrane-associated protease RseP (regulator of RpoE activity)